MTPPITYLGNHSENYDALLCDIWGVIHNGVEAFPEPVDALVRAREAGQVVILITNAPRPNAPIIEQLFGFGVPGEAFDAVLTSGDVARHAIGDGKYEKFYHLGPARDRSLFEGLDITLADEAEEAGAVINTGLFDDTKEHPEDYLPLLDTCYHHDLPMICVNPDEFIFRGEEKVYCAGALAKLYGEAGGDVIYTGKPYLPIYQLAHVLAEDKIGFEITKSRVLGIGDNPKTDLKGAADFGIDFLHIEGGVMLDQDEQRPDLSAPFSEESKIIGRADALRW